MDADTSGVLNLSNRIFNSEDINLVDDESHISSDATSSSTPLTKKRKLRSKVWLDFERDDTNGIAICRQCKKTFKSTSRLGTSHLRSHLEICDENPGRSSIVVLGNDERKQPFNQEQDINLVDDESHISSDATSSSTPLTKKRKLSFNSEDINLVDDESHISSDATSSSTPLTKKRKLRSKVWLDFERDDTNGIVICRQCKKTFKSTSRLGTSHLRSHLEICDENPGRSSIVVLENDERKQPFNQERSRTDLARMIILHEYPFSIVDHVGFRIYSKNLQPDFNMGDLTKLYKWNIDKKLTSLVLDNSSANDVMTREIVSRLSYKLLLNGVMLHVRCCTHIINLIVQDGVKEIGQVIEKVRASMKFVKSSIAREQFLEKWYPVVARMARDILAIRVFTVASESAFSTGGRVLDDCRSSMNPTTVEALLCAQDWI
ncbi:hypothetical protein H6P81_003298 [Aristolochia fimbriata]|uniref:BED-type domain-containing protein n=1 Tax=Aristolochia fimbriata TaxID=158543 RepID=A0AAV7FC67_ARIFI|nr:hypothetical protein H6P81_003298 [Aristolochia fimbriata]